MDIHRRSCVRRYGRTFSTERSSTKRICREGREDIQRQEVKSEDQLGKFVHRKGPVWLVWVLELHLVEEEVCHPHNRPGLMEGGIVFGPRRRSFATKIQNKVYAMAYRTALSYRFGLSQLIMVTPMFLELPKTKLLKVLLRELQWTKNAGGGTLFVTINERANLFKASHVLGADVTVRTVREVKVRDLLLMGRVVIEKGALERLLGKYGVKDGSRRGPLRRDPMKEYERLAKLL